MSERAGHAVDWPYDPFSPRRRPTRIVRIGEVAVGGDLPIRIQSMTNTNTLDTRATVEQATRLAEAGCEIVRVTAPSIRDAENLAEIKKELRARGIGVPLVADIHFTPNAALIAAGIVEKVRINPGNYADKKKFEVREYDDSGYEAEIERVAARFRPLVRRCKQYGVAMRIGTNHGSLSDRIMNRFGDTPEGMVESALEFLDVCEDEGFFDVVFSMKSSNTRVAIAAYRLLAARLEARAPGRPSYPFHVGVTEAGDAEDGRIKSAIGIGALLEDGIGDTIRVSLTEDPVREVPVAREIARVAGARARRSAAPQSGPTETGPELGAATARLLGDPFRPARRTTRALGLAAGLAGDRVDGAQDRGLVLGGEAVVRVELDRPDALAEPAATAARLAVELSALRDVVCESLLVTARDAAELAAVEVLADELVSLGLGLPISLRLRPALLMAEAHSIAALAARRGISPSGPGSSLGRLVVRIDEQASDALLADLARGLAGIGAPVEWELELDRPRSIPVLLDRLLATGIPGACFGLAPGGSPHAIRALAAALGQVGAGRVAAQPIVLHQAVASRLGRVSEAGLIEAAVGLGTPLCDGIGDLVSLASEADAGAVVDLAYRILQGARLRTTRTEYISCPSCGRTLFDLEETTAKIKQRTDHLPGVKIAVMGCIVNGPGEMADADFGYVGSGEGIVTLYVGRQVVERAVPAPQAPDRLVELIKQSGRWVDA